METIGIDLGTTFSLVTVYRDGGSIVIPNAAGMRMTPSAVALDADGGVIVGETAKRRLITAPDTCVSSFKRFMGAKKEITLSGRAFRPEELSAYVLRQLRADAEAFLGSPVEEAVISVPAYFNDAQRRATKRAGELAGLRVDRLVNEPSAAALAYHLQGRRAECDYLVFDFGGGTLDVSVLEAFENVIEILAVAGDNRLGGDDFDQLIVEYFLRKANMDPLALNREALALLTQSAQRCKHALTVHSAVVMSVQLGEDTYSVGLNNQELIALGAPLFARMDRVMRRALEDSGRSFSTIGEIVLVGGSSRMPVVREFIRRLSGKNPLCEINPDEVVALGTGIQAGMKMRKKGLREILLSDVCPFSLGVEIAHDRFSPIIERNCILPTSRVQRYTTVHDGQTRIESSIYQGERRAASENTRLGEIAMDIPPAPAGAVSIDIRFTYDINGILDVEAVAREANGLKEKQQQVILSDGNELSTDEVAKILENMQRLKQHPRDRQENRELLTRGEKLFENSVGRKREQVSRLLSYFEEALDKADERLIHDRFLEVFAGLMLLEKPTYYEDGTFLDDGGGRNDH